MSQQVIKADNLGKSFGSFKAISSLTFEVNKGEILGFLGPSGSGKTTTINILTGQLTPDQGQSSILGKSSTNLNEEDLANIGLITENSGYYEKLSLYDNLLFFAKLYDVPQGDLDDLMKRVGLYDRRKTLAEKLSTGMKQRMLLVRAIINKPQVLFLDEPTSGLDPSTSQSIHELIKELQSEGTTIFLTTHDMHEATILCDKIVLLNKGQIVEAGTPSDLIQKYNTAKRVKITYQSGEENYLSFSELGQVSQTDDILTIHSCEPTLEDVFIQLTGGKLNA
ncbi:ABC transporter ATP-binding protein [Streptococcus salivarius]|jgi:ABC-2 type transport system ATP-binding protein|uniref:ABC transporter ATP-binding protein n=1 Tax=Streptococcus salivarius TaxID=1304 RepID=UPI000214640C|nr:ABC transporter ATP-binding protein [Streptococcus salivarius]MBS6272830.1 ABC transporter ATP-binding protein [Streptococcus salivarius]MCY7055475.1 ABC transporter ATP-binding protein [Streptococcus salivarius]MDU2326390.1 ABC transporter ATP-binding protein [Streptococcus salivarius]MDU2745246.1 ABC transporter ATP-binding protein [Streptococcus salivarius]MDU8068390.1 ABC transporter ATP-binding protein [Streptococcus salivarius]